MTQEIIFEGSRSTAYKRAAAAKAAGWANVNVVPDKDNGTFLVVADPIQAEQPGKSLEKQIKDAEAKARWCRNHDKPHLVLKWEQVVAELRAQS
jgi:hypothetical protein